MDGVLWKGDIQIGNLPAIFERIRARGLKVAFATNNGTQTPEQYVARLAALGVHVEPWQVVTSSLVVAHLLSQSFPSGGPVFAIGESGLTTALREKGFIPLSVDETESAQAVVIGVDRQINFKKMCEATLLVGRGLPFYATNPDKSFPTPRGKLPGAGAWASVIITATNIVPIYAGKPSPLLIEIACNRMGMANEAVLVVGDRVDTDIAAGQAAGCPVAHVLSGISSREAAETWRPRIDIIAENLGELVS